MLPTSIYVTKVTCFHNQKRNTFTSPGKEKQHTHTGTHPEIHSGKKKCDWQTMFFFDFLLLLIPLVVLARWKRFLVQGYPFEGVVKSVHRLEGPPSSGSPKYVLILPYYCNPYYIYISIHIYIYIEQFIAISTPQRSQNCLKSGLEFERKLQYTIMYTVYV